MVTALNKIYTYTWWSTGALWTLKIIISVKCVIYSWRQKATTYTFVTIVGSDCGISEVQVSGSEETSGS
jgi:hypothetical protein